MMKYDLFLSDFDGTLVKGDGLICSENLHAIRKYRERGGIFAVVTGRMLSSILPRLKEAGLSRGLVAAYQGGTVAKIETGEILVRKTFSPSEALPIVRLLEEKDLHIHVYDGEELFCNRDDEYLRTYERICGVKAILVPSLFEKVCKEGRRADKILVMLPPKKREELYFELSRLQTAEVTSSSEFMVEILPRGVGKDFAVKALSEYYSVPIERTAAIGDQLNDLSMLAAAGGKFAVENAEKKLKEIAVVVSSAEEGGVAQALQCAMGDEYERI